MGQVDHEETDGAAGEGRGRGEARARGGAAESRLVLPFILA